ncbi:hypothetical protein CANCADRAFT_55713 [Tortispora caseinolytica NRRL Y-17796]|uniref:ubiquitinyl hydrolase 1 n=1 Tax=Tortispora caseinolytica NRRL Y-17796 TaxID=767744 RepID=A0A1E4TJM5_9ASCO|nr:hypothetical protein CANCADRAFT_55713 [Tortispora caseinolytica NRRL Y-17796]
MSNPPHPQLASPDSQIEAPYDPNFASSSHSYQYAAPPQGNPVPYAADMYPPDYSSGYVVPAPQYGYYFYPSYNAYPQFVPYAMMPQQQQPNYNQQYQYQQYYQQPQMQMQMPMQTNHPNPQNMQQQQQQQQMHQMQQMQYAAQQQMQNGQRPMDPSHSQGFVQPTDAAQTQSFSSAQHSSAMSVSSRSHSPSYQPEIGRAKQQKQQKSTTSQRDIANVNSRFQDLKVSSNVLLPGLSERENSLIAPSRRPGKTRSRRLPVSHIMKFELVDPAGPVAQVKNAKNAKTAKPAKPSASAQSAEPAVPVNSYASAALASKLAPNNSQRPGVTGASASDSDQGVSAAASPSGSVTPIKTVYDPKFLNAIRSFDPTYDPITLVSPLGLDNNSNTCFMNAVMQVLIHCPRFYTLIRELSALSTSSRKLPSKSLTPVLDVLGKFFDTYYQTSRRRHHSLDIDPSYIFKDILEAGSFGMEFGEQHDSAEFLLLLLDRIHEELLSVLKTQESQTNGVNGAGTKVSGAGDGEWASVSSKKNKMEHQSVEMLKTPISSMFFGSFTFDISIKNRRIHSEEPFSDLPVDISDDSIETVEDAIRGLSKPEVVEMGSDTGKKVTLLSKLPLILVVQLKRFLFTVSHGAYQLTKINKQVKFGAELTIPQEVLLDHEPGASLPKYKLFGIVYHHGRSTDSGHYTADVLEPSPGLKSNSWIRTDDQYTMPLKSFVPYYTGEETSAPAPVPIPDHIVNRTADAAETDTGESWADLDDEDNSEEDTKPSLNRGAANESKSAYLLFYQRIA